MDNVSSQIRAQLGIQSDVMFVKTLGEWWPIATR